VIWVALVIGDQALGEDLCGLFPPFLSISDPVGLRPEVFTDYSQGCSFSGAGVKDPDGSLIFWV